MTSLSLTDALRETLALFEDSGTPWTTTEVADRLDVGRRSTYGRLERLVEQGHIETKKVGANARVWWRPPRSSGADGEIERGVIAAEDVTQVNEQARRLERQRDDLERELDEMFARIDDAFFALDEKWRFTSVNERAEDVLDRDRDTLIGANVWEEFPEAADSIFQEQYERALDTQESVTFEAFYPPLDTWFEVRAYPSETGLSVYFGDITERKEYEHDLQRYEALAETASDVLLTIDDQGRIQSVNPAVEETFGYSPRDLIGESLTTLMPEQLVDAHEAGIAQYLRTGERSLDWDYVELPGVRADGAEISLAISFSEYEHGGQHYFTGIIRDITERKERERELERTNERFRKIFEHSNDAIYINDPHEDEIIDVNPAGCEMLGYAREELLSLGPSDCHPDEMDRFEVFVDNVFEEGSGYTDELTCLTKDGRRLPSEISASTLELNDGRAMLAIVRDISERKERERELVRQREQLAALNNLNRVINDITEAVIEESTREEIEETVCERLADLDSYEFAWIGDIDTATQTMDARVGAGVEGYLEEVTVSVDPDDPTGQGPSGKAARTGEIQTVQDVRDDPEYGPWRAAASEWGFRSTAAIPIAHEGTLYGVLNVYADRPKAFEGQEREVIRQLGQVVGHAIAATDRKRALMSDELVELEFQIANIFDRLDASVSTDGTITLEEAVPVRDGEFLMYGTATADAVESVSELVEAVPQWTDVRFRGEEDEGETRFEVRLSDPPILSAVASLGGSFEEAVIKDGDVHMTLHLSPSADVRHLIDVVDKTYPAAEMVTRRQIDRPDLSERLEVLEEGLTDRQRATLQAAYHAGFFEWPREASGEEIADSLDIAGPTFSQHIRKAEQKVFRSILSPPAST